MQSADRKRTERRGAGRAWWALVALMALAASGCELLDSGPGGASCVAAEESLSKTLEEEGKLDDAVPEQGPYPMTMVVSEQAINSLFQAVADNDIPPITLGDRDLGVRIHLALPLIQIGEVTGCAQCILTDLDFGLDVLVLGQEIGGRVRGVTSFPLLAVPNGLESTKLMGRFDETGVISLDVALTGTIPLGLTGLANEALATFREPIRREVEAYLREELGSRELFELEPWEIGDGEVKLLARGPIIYPEYGTVVLGMHTNLVRPLAKSVEVAPELPPGIDMGLQFHPELLGVMVQRMLHEGHIERSYDNGGAPSSQGNNQVTLAKMERSETTSGLLTTAFSLWRTGGYLCGEATLQADLGLAITDRQLKFTAQDVQITGGQGALGSGARLLGSWVDSPLVQELIGVTEITVNYDEMSLPNDKRAEFSADAFALGLDGAGLRLFLNLDAVVDAVTE